MEDSQMRESMNAAISAPTFDMADIAAEMVAVIKHLDSVRGERARVMKDLQHIEDEVQAVEERLREVRMHLLSAVQQEVGQALNEPTPVANDPARSGDGRRF